MRLTFRPRQWLVLAQAEQSDVGFEVGGFEIFAEKCQTSMGTEVVGELFDNKVGHSRIHLQSEQHYKSKSLIYIDKSDVFTM